MPPGPNAQLMPKDAWEYVKAPLKYHWYWTLIRRHSNSSTPARGLMTSAWVHSEPSLTRFFSNPKPGPMPTPK